MSVRLRRPLAAARLERLRREDLAMLRIVSPVILGHTLKVLLLERAADGSELRLERLRERIAAGLDAEPRMRQRLRATPFHLAPPAWVPDPDFELGRHVRSREPLSPGDEGLRESIAAAMTERLNPERPLWAIDLLGPLAGGRAAVVCRFHHVMADGRAAIRMMRHLLWSEPPSAPPRASAPEPKPAELLADGLRYRSQQLREALASPLAHLDEWRDRVRGFALLRRVLWRELGGSPATTTPLDARIGRRREVAWAHVSLAAAKQIAHASHPRATVNDVLLASIGGGLRTWLPPEAARLRAKVPVSMHRGEEDPRIGNRDSFFFVDLAASERDPGARLEAIGAQTRVRKRTDAETLHRFIDDLRAIGPLSRPIERLVADPHAFTVEISNLRGPAEPISVADHSARELLTFAEPAHRHALRITAISLAGRIAIGLCSDPDVAPPLGGLATAIERELEGLGQARTGRAPDKHDPTRGASAD
jgi:diacylglycerol O-acyltransferase / wax synthase